MTAPGVPAWPFLVGRAEHAGYRVVVAPDFMTDPAAVAALASAARSTDVPGGAAVVRELRGLGPEPVCVVYRSQIARASDYGLGGDADLVEEHGRGIRLAEGLVLRLPAEAAARAGITRSDFDRAHARLVAPFQAFWAQDEAFVRQAAEPYLIGADTSEDSQILLLTVDQPWIRRDPASGPNAPVTTERALSPILGEPPGRGEVRRVFSTRLVLTAGAAGVLILFLILFLLHSWSAPHRSSTAQNTVLTGFCDAVDQASPGAAYSFMAPAYQQQTGLARFAASLFPAGLTVSAANCTFQLTNAASSTTEALVTIHPPYTHSRTWLALLSAAPDGSWYITGLEPASQESKS